MATGYIVGPDGKRYTPWEWAYYEAQHGIDTGFAPSSTGYYTLNGTRYSGADLMSFLHQTLSQWATQNPGQTTTPPPRNTDQPPDGQVNGPSVGVGGKHELPPDPSLIGPQDVTPFTPNAFQSPDFGFQAGQLRDYVNTNGKTLGGQISDSFLGRGLGASGARDMALERNNQATQYAYGQGLANLAGSWDKIDSDNWQTAQKIASDERTAFNNAQAGIFGSKANVTAAEYSADANVANSILQSLANTLGITLRR